MSVYLNPQLVPKDGKTLRVLIPCRVSSPGPGKQDIRSLDDQEAMLTEWLESNTDLLFDVTVIAGSGSGEWLDRKEYQQLIAYVETGQYDLVLSEGLDRIVRRIQAHLFAELCVDCDTRLIALNDHVDTAQEGWQDRSIFSAWHHERSNRDTSERIKRSHRNRFDQGGCAAIPIFGYIKPDGAKSDEDWFKDPDAEPIYKQWFEMLDEGASYSEIADWLNSEKVLTGPYCDQDNWDGKMVSRVTHNMLLKGYRYRNKRKSKRKGNGQYKSVRAAPDELRLRHVPRLAFFEEDYYDRVVAEADERNAQYNAAKNGPDPRKNRPKKRSTYPGQHLYCGVCGHMLRYGGHGQNHHLLCRGACEYSCWMGITANGPLSAEKLAQAVLETIAKLPDFDQVFREQLEHELSTLQNRSTKNIREIDDNERRVERQLQNVSDAIREAGHSQRLLEDLRELEAEQKRLTFEKKKLENLPESKIEIPSMSMIRELAKQAISNLAIDSPEFARLMKRLISEIVVFPFRLIDGGHIVLRAKFTLNLAPLISEVDHVPTLADQLSRELIVDLFEPPQREEYRKRVVALRSAGKSEKKIANQLGITITAAQHAAKLQRMMDEAGLTDPYLPVMEPPADYNRLRRHKHPRYKFEPLTDDDVD